MDESPHKALAPVRYIPGDEDKSPQPGTALCLSGGGYRAMLFHLGALWRLNESGYLTKLDRISSVSGGSILASVLGMNWSELAFDEATGVAAPEAFREMLVNPIRGLAGRSLDWKAVLIGALPGSSVSWNLTWMYNQRLFKGATLQSLPSKGNGPRIILNATNLQSGVLWRFSQPYSWDYRVGKLVEPEIPLAKAVAASSAFPPVLAPARFRFAHSDYEPGTGDDLQHPPFTTRPVLADGGVYDNLGLETAWKSCQTVLVSDGGGHMSAATGKLLGLGSWRWREWGTQSARVLAVVDNQVRELRKRQVIEGFKAGPGDPQHRSGTYWGIRGDLGDYGLGSSLQFSQSEADELASIKTRLKRLDPNTQERLINWGYVVSDTALRRWVDQSLPVPEGMPYPDA
jgi:NTE family protein